MILVFGADGQLGRALAAAAADASVHLTGLSRREGDITQPAAVAAAIERHSPRILVNAAGYTRVDDAESEPEAALAANATGAKVLADLAAKADLPLVHISTDYVFDGSKPTAYTEEDPVSPIGAYGRSKALGEAAVRAAAPRHLVLRPAWLYSDRGRNFLTTILRLARERPELRVVADQRGSPTAAADLAAAIIAVAPRLLAADAPYGLYNLAGAGETTWHGFAERIVARQSARTGLKPRVVPIATADYPTPASRPANSVLDSGKFQAAFGVVLPRWQDTVDRTIGDIISREVGT